MDSDIVSGAGNENGFYVYSDDTITDYSWNVSYYAYDNESEIYVNGTKVSNAIIKKFEAGKCYVGLLDASVTAKAGDIVTVQGIVRYCLSKMYKLTDCESSAKYQAKSNRQDNLRMRQRYFIW